MRDDICTIPVSEVFEQTGGCPICRMRDTVEERILSYILGDAMMEPDVRIETNKTGFCEYHYDRMMNRRGRLQLALMLQTHMDEINRTVFEKKLFRTDAKKRETAKQISNSCFVCEKIEWGLSRMLETVFRCYENEREFREMFNRQEMFCLPHYERLMNGAAGKTMKRYGGEFCDNLTRITGAHCRRLSEELSRFCSLYDYRSKKEDSARDPSKNAVEHAVAFLNGRIAPED